MFNFLVKKGRQLSYERKYSCYNTLENNRSYSKSSRSKIFVIHKASQPSSVSICKLPLFADSKVFERNYSSSALRSSPCASIVTSSGQEHKDAITRIVNCLLPEMAMCSSSCMCSLALKMAIWSSLGQLEISRRSKYVAVIIICCKWRLDNCVEARFKYLSDLNALCGIQQYSFPVPDRSSSLPTGYGFYKTCRSFSCDLCADHLYLFDKSSPQSPWRP